MITEDGQKEENDLPHVHQERFLRNDTESSSFKGLSTKQLPSNDDSIFLRSDFMFASSDEEDSVKTDSDSDFHVEEEEHVVVVTISEGSSLEAPLPDTATIDERFCDSVVDQSNTDIVSENVDLEREEVSEHDSATTSSSTEDDNDESQPSRTRGQGRSRPRGRSLSIGRSLTIRRGRGRGHLSMQRSRPRSYLDLIPEVATSITIPDAGHSDPPNFNPLRLPGPHLPDEPPKSELDYFRLFFDDEILEKLVASTNNYAEERKDQLKSMYRRFKIKNLTKMKCLLT